MPTRLYRFHCTDGHDLVADMRGKRLPTPALIRLHAERVALDLMLHGSRLDWSAWYVEVYDAKGRPVLERAFTDVRDGRPAVGAAFDHFPNPVQATLVPDALSSAQRTRRRRGKPEA